MKRVLIFAVLCAACLGPVVPETAPSNRVEVKRVILYRDVVTVEMSDGALCVGKRFAGQTWSGLLQGCPHPMVYEVYSRPSMARAVLKPAQTGVVRIGAQFFG